MSRGSDRAAARHPAFRWANTMLANIKNSLLATNRAVEAKQLPRYGAFAWRFNRRDVLKTISRASRHCCNDNSADAIPPPQIGCGSTVSGMRVKRRRPTFAGFLADW
jgi:hypothetical protein